MKFSTLSIIGLIGFSTALINCTSDDSDGGSTSALGSACTTYYDSCCIEAANGDATLEQNCRDSKKAAEDSVAQGTDPSSLEAACQQGVDAAQAAGLCGGGGSGGSGNGGTGGTANGGTGGTANGGTGGTANGGTGGTANGGTGGTANGGTGGSSSGDACTDGGSEHADCATCQQTEFSGGGCCESEYNACEANSECGALNDCANNCGANDSACIQQCAADHQAGVNDLLGVIDCTFGDPDQGTVGACGNVCQ